MGPNLIMTGVLIRRGKLNTQRDTRGSSLVVQWLRLCAPNAGGLGSIPGQGARSHMLQLRVCMPQLKTLHAATKDSACSN